MHKLPFSSSTLKSSHPLNIVFSDVWTSPIYSVDGFKYYVLFVDHYTRYIWLYPLKHKSQVKEVFTKFKSLVENRFQHKLRTLYSDNGGEYVGLAAFLSSHGISHMTSPPHTPEHNGLAERRHRHIVETGLALMSHASMPKGYWSYAFVTAVYLINRMPTQNLEFQTPFEKLHGHSPNFQKLRIFGCLCFSWLRPYASHKLDDRSKPCVFLGYSLTQSAYLCLDRATNRIYSSRHVIFHESVFPFSTSSPVIAAVDSDVELPSCSNAPVSVVSPISNLQVPTPTAGPAPPVLPDTTPSEPVPTMPTQPLNENRESPPQPEAVPTVSPLPPAPTRASTRPRKPVQKLNLNTQVDTPPTTIPRSVAEALKSPYWRKAMSEEMESQLKERTWSLNLKNQLRLQDQLHPFCQIQLQVNLCQQCLRNLLMKIGNPRRNQKPSLLSLRFPQLQQGPAQDHANQFKN